MCFVRRRRGQLSAVMTEHKAGGGSVSTAAQMMFGQVCGTVRAALPHLVHILQRPLRVLLFDH